MLIRKEAKLKKIVPTIVLILVFFLIYFLQVNFFNYVTIAGVKPNLFVVFILFIGLFTTGKYAMVAGIICGIYLDLMYSQNIGITAIMFCIVGFLGGYFDKNFSKENRITIMLMVVGCTIIFEVGCYFLNIIISQFNIEIAIFSRKLAIEVLYNTLLVIVLYPLIQKGGYSIELKFKRNNILTRYF